MTVTKKKLIEVSLPLESINRGCVEDKNRKTGHIRNLHKWFAPMPLPAWRAMLFASLVDDPGEDSSIQDAARERERLFGLIERLSTFDAYRDTGLMTEARREVTKAVGDRPPIVIDPFCGGGSTILEAQRLGLPTIASDLNPVPVLIATVLCRVPGLFGNCAPVSPTRKRLIDQSVPMEGFKTDVLYYANRVRERAWEKLGEHFPLIEGATPFAYRWAWSVTSPDPSAQGKLTPLVSNWWLSRRKGLTSWVQPVLGEQGVRFEIASRGATPNSTVHRSGAVDLHSTVPIPLEYIREQGRGGKLRPVLLAIGVRDGATTSYVAGDDIQRDVAMEVPDIEIQGIPMPNAALGFRVQQYGITNFLGLFTRRQAYSLATFADQVATVRNEIVLDAVRAGLVDDGVSLEAGGDGARAYADAVVAVLGLCVGKMAQSNNILVRWFLDPRNGSGKATPAFDRQAVPMVWDFVETNPFGGSVGDWVGPVLETALRAFDLTVASGIPAAVSQADARRISIDSSQRALLATDPPYYANIGYADLSDFFYLWLRQALRPSFPMLYGTLASPKMGELIAAPSRHGGSTELANDYFRTGFTDVFSNFGALADDRFPMLIVYALKQSEESNDGVHSTGWEVFLEGIIESGIAVVATWPVRTTTDTRMRGIRSNALTSAIFVVGRRRDPNAPTIPRREFVAALRAELPRALEHLKHGNIAPVDLEQAAIGPGMAVFTRYAQVLDAEGRRLSVREALAQINQTLDETLTEQEGDYDADTRWALTWFEQSGFSEGEFGVAEQLSKSRNTSIGGLAEAGILESKRGMVRLLMPQELPVGWDPLKDRRLTVWEIGHQLIRVLETGGESAAAELMARLGTKAEIARELAYRLYTICDRKKYAAEALSYNGLVQSWPEISRIARESSAPTVEQVSLFGSPEE